MLPPLPNQEPDAAGNRDRHAGTDATGNSMDVPPHRHVPTRISAWRSFPRRRPRRIRPREDERESLIYKDYFRQNPLRGAAGHWLASEGTDGTYRTYGTNGTYGTKGTI